MTRAKVVLLALVGLVITAASGTQVWLEGVTDDAVLGASRVSAIGSQAASGAVALAVVVLAALVAAMVAGARVRKPVLVVGLAAAVGQVVHVALAAFDPSATLGPLAAAAVGRNGSIPVTGSTGPWAWIGLAGAVVLVVAAALGVLSAGRWPVPTKRYDAPDPSSGRTAQAGTSQVVTGRPEGVRSGPRGERVRSEWDSLSEGHDPTDVPPGEST